MKQPLGSQCWITFLSQLLGTGARVGKKQEKRIVLAAGKAVGWGVCNCNLGLKRGICVGSL